VGRFILGLTDSAVQAVDSVRQALLRLNMPGDPPLVALVEESEGDVPSRFLAVEVQEAAVTGVAAAFAPLLMYVGVQGAAAEWLCRRQAWGNPAWPCLACGE
jgi:hypothetical protein